MGIPLVASTRVSRLAVVLAFLSLLLVTTSSQWGMILLSTIYAAQGREALALTPELLGGTSAAIAVLLVLLLTRVHFVWARSTWALVLPLIAFVLMSTLGELLRAEIQWRNIVMFLSLVTYFFVGGICGQVLFNRHLNHVAALLLLVFSGWYVGLAALAIVGFLNYENVLTGALTLRRLEVLGGFTATEIPIYVGMHIPLLLFMAIGPFGITIRVVAYALLLPVFAVLYLTASVGALVATAIVISLFITLAARTFRARALVVMGALIIVTTIAGGAYVRELIMSVGEKVEIVDTGGGRAESTDLLVSITRDNPWIGIGKSRFQEINNLGYFGEGIYPHSNLLGIAAELGLPAAMAYFVFLVGISWHLLSQSLSLRNANQNPAALLLVAITSILAFQQARGLLHDTWTVKEVYFWLGFGVGVTSLISHNRRRARHTDAAISPPVTLAHGLQS